jgi:hypothetical protein
MQNFVGNSEIKKLSGRTTHRCEYNLIWIFKIVWKCKLWNYSAEIGYKSEAGYCANDKNNWVPLKAVSLLTREAITKRLRDSALRSRSVGQSFGLIATNEIIEQIRSCSNVTDFILGGVP